MVVSGAQRSHTPAASYLPLLQRTRHACLAASPDIFVTNEGLHEFRASLAPGRAYVVSPGRNLQLATAAVAATAITVATGVGGLILHAARAALLRLHHEQGRVVTGRPVVGVRHMVPVSHSKACAVARPRLHRCASHQRRGYVGPLQGRAKARATTKRRDLSTPAHHPQLARHCRRPKCVTKCERHGLVSGVEKVGDHDHLIITNSPPTAAAPVPSIARASSDSKRPRSRRRNRVFWTPFLALPSVRTSTRPVACAVRVCEAEIAGLRRVVAGDDGFSRGCWHS